MPPKSNNQKKKEAEAAGKAPKKTKQQENAGRSMPFNSIWVDHHCFHCNDSTDGIDCERKLRLIK